MAPETDHVLEMLLQGFRPIQKEVRKLVEDQRNALPYQEGACLTRSDIATMRITFDMDAQTQFWEPANDNTRCALEVALEEISSNLETLLKETNEYKEKFTKCHCPTIEDAYSSSTEYSRTLQYLVTDGLLYNEALVDSSGDDLFRDLGVSYYRTHIHMETSVVFSSPRHPHITVLSVQPQRASSQKELLCTEFWTLYYWAQKFARRAFHTTHHCLPIRLVSLCGYEARVVSAVFSLGYPRSIANRSVKCQIHIDEYRDLSLRQHFQDLMEELVATPCGNAEVQQKSSEKKKI